MKTDKDKTKDELLGELKELRKYIGKVGELELQLKDAQHAYTVLNEKFDNHTKQFERECDERNKIENALRLAELIVEQSPVILFRRLAGELSRMEYISNNISQFGYSPEEFVSGDLKFRDIVHPDDFDRVGKEVEEYAKTDVEEYGQAYRILTKSGEVRWVADKTSVVRNEAGEKTHNQGILYDMTKRKLIEIALRKSEEKYRRIVETAAEGFVLLNQDLVITDVNNAYCRLMGYSRDELLGKRPFDLATDSFRQYIHFNRETLLAQEYREFEATGVAKDGRVVPVLIHGNALKNDSGEIIGHMAFVTDMTHHKKALALAGEVQKSLLPQEQPLVQGFDIAGKNISCDEIGGDYYDFLWRREPRGGPFSVVVGDICGHGVDSALLMTTARAFLRMRVSQPGTLSEIITAMNHHLALDLIDTGRFMTLFYLMLDPIEKKISWIRAGHDPGLFYDPLRDEFEELKGAGIALGVTSEFIYPENQRKGLANGQIIAIGTDGIWEACNLEGGMFGKDRFRDIIRNKAGEPATSILNGVYDELSRFTVGKKTEDDITLVIIKVAGL